MASYRRWLTTQNYLGEETISSVLELRARFAERMSYRRRRRVARGTPGAMIIPVVVDTPAGNPKGVERNRQRTREARLERERSYWTRKRRVGFVHFMQEPTPFIQTGIKPLIRWNEVIAEQDLARRQARIRGTANELAFNYSWLKVGDPFGYILAEIQRHMMEVKSDMGKTWFDPFWTTDEVLDWLETRTNQFLVATGAYRVQEVVDATAEIEMPNMNDLRRAVYFDPTGASTPLEITDTHAKDMSTPGWGALPPGTPDSIIVWGKGSTARLVPPPPTTNPHGHLLLDYVPRFFVRDDELQRGVWWDRTGGSVPPPAPPTRGGPGSGRGGSGSGSSGGVIFNTSVSNDLTVWPGRSKPLPIPNIFYPYVKYGVMADMLSKEGEGQDMVRAKYCEDRFQEGIELAKMMLGRK